MSDSATIKGFTLSLEEVTQVIQKLREDQEEFLQQQRDVIIQQVLETIQQSGLFTSSSNKFQKSNKKDKISTSTSRLEQNLHTLVHHSLAESGLNFPHVYNTADQVSTNRVEAKTISKKKPIIQSRREFERREPSDSSSQDNTEDNEDILLQDLNQALSHSPLEDQNSTTTRTKSGLKLEKRHRRNRKDPYRYDADITDDYTEFINPVDADFNAVRKKVDMRTLAILERSKLLLNQVKQNSSIDAKTSFVDKLRQRYREVEEVPEATKEMKTKAFTNDTNLTDQQTIPLEIEEKGSLTIDSSAIRCDLELLQPPPKSPDNENEWENELARQILTIYATSIKAKELEKTSNKPQNDNQTRVTDSIQSISRRKSPDRKKLTLKTPCSLPIIRNNLEVKPTYRSAVRYSWEPSQIQENGKVIVNMPRIPRPIWFAGTGAVKAVWCALADGFLHLRSPNNCSENSNSIIATSSLCDHQLCEQVRQLETKKKFAQCITTLESLLVALVRARGGHDLEMKLWKQLIVTCNAFASRCIDYQKFPAALQLIKQAEHLIDNSILVEKTTRFELLAYLYDTYAHYYYKRRKSHAGLQYILKAHEIHNKQSSWSHLAKCRLHIANLLSFQMKHTEAMKYMAIILEMIEHNKLEETSEQGSAQKLCLAAVCYNNLAVEQLHLREFEAASVSSANAQRLAKLCLSYSNRWLSQFQATSDCVALAIATLMEDMNADKNPLAEIKTLTG